MSHSHKLSPFKLTLKNSWHFYKANWKELVLLFLPIELIIFLLTLILAFGLSPARFAWVYVLASIVSLLLTIASIFKKLLIFGGGSVVKEIGSGNENGQQKRAKYAYREILLQAVPMIWVGVLETLFMSTVAAFAFLVSFVVFLLPFILLSLLARLFPDVLYFLDTQGGALSITMLIISSIVFTATNIFFMARIWFSSYVLLLEGRIGLDALSGSFSYTKEKGWSLAWRLILIGLLVLLPVLIIVGPIYVKILIVAVKQMAIVFALGLKPVFPQISGSLIFWRSALSSLAALIAAPAFITLGYFLWKDLKASAPIFEEGSYTKARKRIKIAVCIGAVLTLIYPILAIIIGLASVFAK
jgi:hypothetical protein